MRSSRGALAPIGVPCGYTGGLYLVSVLLCFTVTRPRRALRSHRHNGEVHGFQLHAHFGGNLRKTPNASHRPLLYSRMRELQITRGTKDLDADTISFVWTSIRQRYSVKGGEGEGVCVWGGSRSCLTCAKCGAMGNCHTSGSSPRSGAGFSALLCSNAGSWTRSRTPGNFSLGAPSTKALLKGASARYKDSYAIRRRGIQLETRLWTSGSQSVGWLSAA